MTNRKDRKGREMETDGLNVGEYVDQMALLLDLQQGSHWGYVIEEMEIES